MKTDYGVLIPDEVYIWLGNFIGTKPKAVRMALGILVYLPLLIFDFLLCMTAPLVVFALCSLVTLPIGLFSSRLTAAVFLFQIAMMGLNRYAILRGTKWMTGLWVAYLAIINISFIFIAHDDILPVLTGGLFMAMTMVNAAIEAAIIFERGPSTLLKYARIFTELALLALVYSL